MSDEGRQPANPHVPGAPVDWLALKDRALDVAAEGVVIADARCPGRPLIYVNEGFERMTGYTAADALGRNCRFLQGPGTEAASVAEIRTALDERRECLVEILNYRKDGTPFWNRLSITPVRDRSGEVTHFIGIQSDVTARRRTEEGLRRSMDELELDLKLAARVQQALLPPQEVQSGGLRIAHAFLPCDDLAGDSVGIVPLPEGRLGIYVLDVSGHGVGASLLSFTLTHLLSPGIEGTLLTERTGTVSAVVPPSRVVEQLNRQFPITRTNQYFTMVYGVIDAASSRFQYVVAGHPAPVLLPTVGEPVVVAGAGLPVGVLEEATYADESVMLNPGDRLYLYTDGIVEALNADEEEFGQARLLAEIGRWRHEPLRAGLDLVVAAIRAWNDGPLSDDISLVAIERSP